MKNYFGSEINILAGGVQSRLISTSPSQGTYQLHLLHKESTLAKKMIDVLIYHLGRW